MEVKIILVVFSLVGFFLSLFLKNKKIKKEKITCHFNSNCNAVMQSDQASFFGVPVENLGIFYFGALVIIYFFSIVFPMFLSPFLNFILLNSITIALLFSLYLAFIQSAYLKQRCSWCFLLVGLCLLIFSVAFSFSKITFLFILAKFGIFIIFAHLIGISVGLGAAIISMVLLFDFLGDFRVSKQEENVIKIFSQIVWISIAVLVITDTWLYVAAIKGLNHSGAFLLKTIILFLIIIARAGLDLLVTPRLIKMSGKEKSQNHHQETKKMITFSFDAALFSLLSWCFMFFLTILVGIYRFQFKFFPLFLFYFTIIAVGFLIKQKKLNQFFNKQFNKKLL